MRKASVHPGTGLSEERSATTLPHADPYHASESATNTLTHAHTHTCRYVNIQTHSSCIYTHTLTQYTSTLSHTLRQT